MKSKFILSTLALILFALLGGGSIDPDDIGGFFVMLLVVVAVVAIIAGITAMVQSHNRNKRLQMIKEDEENSTDFDRSVFIGDDRLKIYFDSNKKQVMLMRVTTDGIKKEYVNDFVFPGKELAIYSNPVFNIYDPVKRRLLSGSYSDYRINHQIISIAEKDNNKDVAINNTIQPRFRMFTSSAGNIYHILIEENRGLIAYCKSGGVGSVFNYIKAGSLSKKRGDKSTVNTRAVGNYLFIMDEFFKVLVIVGESSHEIFNYTDIIEVSYEENGNQLYTKSAGRTVGGAIVGGVLMGGAGAVVGGLSGASKQNKEVKSIDIKILLRSTSRTSHVLHFNDANRVLKTKEDADRKLYEQYTKNANEAKDLLSVIIDDAKQATTQVVPVMSQPVAPQSTSVADELSKLAKLKADGILTEEEFQAQKAKLLG